MLFLFVSFHVVKLNYIFYSFFLEISTGGRDLNRRVRISTAGWDFCWSQPLVEIFNHRTVQFFGQNCSEWQFSKFYFSINNLTVRKFLLSYRFPQVFRLVVYILIPSLRVYFHRNQLKKCTFESKLGKLQFSRCIWIKFWLTEPPSSPRLLKIFWYIFFIEQ